MTFGYARVSTDNQELNRQIDLLNQYSVDEIYSEKITGTKRNRPKLNELMRRVRNGDSIVIESLSRLGRSTKDLLNIMSELKEKGVQVISLKENIDTDTPTGQLIITVLSAISQFERDVIVQRTKEGIQSAQARGVKFGRPKVSDKITDKIVALYKTGQYSYNDIADMTGVSTSTVYRALKNTDTI